MKKTLFMINLLSAALLFTSCGGTPGPTNPFLTLGENEYGVQVLYPNGRAVNSKSLFVMWCDGELCYRPQQTDENGFAKYKVDNISSGQLDIHLSGIPEGYVWDADRNEYVKKEEVGLYIYSDNTYYYGDGTVALEKGVLISKKDFEIIKKYCTTTKPVVNTATENSSNNNQQPTQEQTQTVDEGKVNVDGTYTIYGTTYMDKATFEAFLLDDNSNQNFGLYNGVIYPASVINEMNAQKSR